MLDMSVPWWELVLRATAVYAFLLVLLRLTGKRQIGQLSPFDLVLLLILSNAVQNSMNAGDNSLIGGLISATVLIFLNYLIGQLTFRSTKLEGLIEGRPQLLIHKGEIYKDVLAKNQLTHQELHTALRQHGCTEISEVRLAMLEDNGTISVIPYDSGKASS